MPKQNQARTSVMAVPNAPCPHELTPSFPIYQKHVPLTKKYKI